MMYELATRVNALYEIIASYPFLAAVTFISLFFKTISLVFSIANGLKLPTIPRPWFFLIMVLVGSMFSDIAWLASSMKQFYFPHMDYRPICFLVRIAWAFGLIFYQSLGLFLESLTESVSNDAKRRLPSHRIILVSITTVLAFIVVGMAFFGFNQTGSRSSWEFGLIKVISIYFFVIIIPSLIITIRRIHSRTLPRILQKQLKVLLAGFIFPYIVFDFIQVFPFNFFPGYVASNLAVVSISTALLTFAFFFCARRVMGLRFLNFHNHVQSISTFNRMDDFKLVLEQISQVSSSRELVHIVQSFFKTAFRVAPSTVKLYIRSMQASRDDEPTPGPINSAVENFISTHHAHDCKVMGIVRDSKILIYDEIAFSNFYHEISSSTEIVDFLEVINADIFLPIFYRTKMIAYVIIERHARPELYSNIERDEMVVFVSYLGNIINVLQNRNLDAIVRREKLLEEELYRKHQEINQYKESMRSFTDEKQRKIGIIFYKNRHFYYGNQEAKELIDVNLNVQEGHPFTKLLRGIAQQVQDYKSPQRAFAKDSEGKKLVCSAIPNLEQNNVIIIIYYAEISDILRRQIDLLKNPTEWDYLLYLETTRSGQLINQLIPGSGGNLLNYKIELLKLALSKNALLLEMPEEDLMATVEILHHISLREILHVMTLQPSMNGSEIAIKLFGINPIFGTQQEEALLEKLNGVGTLFIQNVHLLDMDTQNNLADFIKYGHFQVYKSEQKVSSTVRIMCSTNKNLTTLVQEGKFSKSLFAQLRETTVTMPSLLTLPLDEINELVEGFTEQAIASTDLKEFLELNDKEKARLVAQRPVSLVEFKEKIRIHLVEKSKRNNVYEDVQFDPAYEVSDPLLVEAARLGRKSLKDPKLLEKLWQKFKNQNKIAIFLGVNRSSINRRLKEYGIE